MMPGPTTFFKSTSSLMDSYSSCNKSRSQAGNRVITSAFVDVNWKFRVWSLEFVKIIG